MNMTNRTVLVTGSNRGIGRALVEEALRRGANRVYAGTRGGALAPTDARVTPVRLDVTSEEQIAGAVESVESLDILFNNAGMDLGDDLRGRAGIERHLAVNLFGTYGVTQAFLPLLVRSRGATLSIFCLWLHWQACHSRPPTRSPKRPRSRSRNRFSLVGPDEE